MKRKMKNRILCLTFSFLVAILSITFVAMAQSQASIATISFLSGLSSGVEYQLTPAFSSEVKSYQVTVPDYRGRMNFIAGANTAASDASSLIKYKYTNTSNLEKKGKVNQGKATPFIGLIGNGSTGNSFSLSVGPSSSYSESETLYQFSIKRKVTLKALTINDTMYPNFNAEVTQYYANLPEGNDTVTLNPVGYSEGYTVKINGKENNTQLNLSDLAWSDNKSTLNIEVSCNDTESTVYSVTLLKQTDTPTIGINPESATYFDDETSPKPLKVMATGNGELTYQWYETNENNNSSGQVIENAVNTEYTPEIPKGVTSDTIKYYYCEVTNTINGESKTAKSDVAAITTKQSPRPTVTIRAGEGEEIPADGYTYEVEREGAKTLQVTATSSFEGSSFSYQWMREYRLNGKVVQEKAPGESTSTSYTPSTAYDSSYLYYCDVTNTYNGKPYMASSDKVTVKVVGAATPVITTDLVDKTCYTGAGVSLTCGAKAYGSQSSSQSALTSRQWYRSSNGTDFEAVPSDEGGDHAIYKTPARDVPGKDYYYCEFRNGVTSIVDGKSYLSTKKTTTITVTTEAAPDPSTYIDLDGKGSKNNPFLVKKDADWNQLKTAVNEKKFSLKDLYFKVTADTALPADWTPIGVDDCKFSGNIDGGDCTLTVPENGKPLLGYIRNASIKKISISGKKIAGYGLVDNYAVDYSDNPAAIDIDHVTIKSGTTVLKSGFIGGFASGSNIVNIRNCTIEDNVTIGYSKTENNIGAFAGDFNGNIINCKSEADVYGVNYVGGLVGSKGQSMGAFSIKNSTFSGTVTSTGKFSGGIAGSGYAATNFTTGAPNAPWPTIQNCHVTGTITGADYVGGVLGGEEYVNQCWNNGIGYIQNNLFTGNISATGSNMGGIIGYANSLNKNTIISNNYYSKDCGAEKGIGYIKIIDTSHSAPNKSDDSVQYINTANGISGIPIEGVAHAKENRTDDPIGSDSNKLAKTVTKEELENGTVQQLLNNGENSFGNWELENGVPTLSDKPVAYALTLSGTYKTEYNIGDSFSAAGMKITATYTDSHTENINPKDKHLQFTGFDTNIRGSQTIKVKYKAAETSYKVTVLYKEPEAIKVTFKLLGDSAHGESGTKHTLKDGNLTTWIPSTTYTIDQNTTVKDVFERAARENGISWVNTTGNYIESITRNGVTLAEFTNGKLSGWMYTINGHHSDLGVSEQYLNNNDTIIFHYTDDYTKEEGSDRWEQPGDEKPPVSQDVASTVKDGEASSTVTSSDVDKLIESALKNEAATIELNVKGADKADKISLELPKASLSAIASKTDAALNITTPAGVVNLNRKTMTEIAKAAEGATVKLKLEKKSVSDAQKEVLGADAAITEVTILSGDKEITTFGGNKIKLSFPVPDKLKNKTLAAAHIDEKGLLTKMAGKVITKDGKSFYQIETPHLSQFVIAEEAAIDAAIKAQDGESDEKTERMKKGIQATTIKASSTGGKSYVGLKWTKSKGYKVDGYQVYRAVKNTKNFKSYGTTKKTTYKDVKNLAKGSRYYYKVRGYRIIDGQKVYTKWSNVTSRRMKGNSLDVGVKNTTIRVSAKAGKGYVKLDWKKSAGCRVDGYQVYRSVKTDKNFKKYGTTKKTTYNNAKSLKKGARYYYKVRGYRTIDGKKVYTQWSETMSRIAK